MTLKEIAQEVGVSISTVSQGSQPGSKRTYLGCCPPHGIHS